MTLREKFLRHLSLVSLPLLFSAKIVTAAAPVESSHYNTNTFTNLNTLTSTGPITFTITYNSAGDVNWYKDNVLVQTNYAVTTASITTAWTASNYGQVKQMRVNATNTDGTSTDMVWNVEVAETGTAVLEKHTIYPQSRIEGVDTIYMSNGWTNLPSIYLFARQSDNYWIEYVRAKTYLIKQPILVDGATLYIDSNTAKEVYMQGTPDLSARLLHTEIRLIANAMMSIDKVKFYGWDVANNRETDENSNFQKKSPVLHSYQNNQMDIRNSTFRHLSIFYDYDQSAGDVVENSIFVGGANANILGQGSKGQVISHNTFYHADGEYGINFWYDLGDRKGDGTGTIVSNNRFLFSVGENVVLSKGTKFLNNEVVYSRWNMVEVPSNTFSKFNNLHDNGGNHNGFNIGPSVNAYLINDYCHALTNYSCFYPQTGTDVLGYPNHIYIINSYAKDSTGGGIGSHGAWDSYYYNYTAMNAPDKNQMGADNVVYRKSSMSNAYSGTTMVDTYIEQGFDYVKNLYVIDSQFSQNARDYFIYSDPTYNNHPIIWSINTFRKNGPNLQIPVTNFGARNHNGEVRNYSYLDAFVQDANSNAVSGATITIEPLIDSNYPAITVNLPPPPPEINDYPAEQLSIPDIGSFSSVSTGSDGHTPLPNYGWSQNIESAAALLFEKDAAGENITNAVGTANYVYRITATHNGNTVFKDVTPDASWYREDPAQPSKTVILTLNKPEGKVALNVNGGTINGSVSHGLYTPGQTVNISAVSAPSGKIFDKWIGDTSCIADPNSSSTCITLPSSDTSVTAYYKDITYHLTVTNGDGSGDYPAGKIVVVDASSATATQVFHKWTGTGVSSVVSPAVYSSMLIMPDHDIVVNATYRNPVSYDCHLTVADGEGTDFYSPGDNVSVSAPASPFTDMIFDHWEGDTENISDVGSCDTTLTNMPASYRIIYPVYRDSGLPSNNAYLSNLTISVGALSPRFTSGNAGYTVRVGTGVASVTVTPTALKGVSAAITVNGAPVNSGSATGNINLNGGSTAITVIVTAPDAVTTRTYTITVIRTSATEATGYTLTAPSPASGEVNAASGNFTVTPNGTYTGTITVTPSGGGLSTPFNVSFANSSEPRTFCITPATAGTVTLTPTNSGGLADPAAVTYTSYISGTLRSASWNYPNPVNFTKIDKTTVTYTVAEECNVYICLYTLAGDLAKVLVDNKSQAPGKYYIDWYGDTDGGGKAASGVYLYVAKIGDDIIRKKIVVLR